MTEPKLGRPRGKDNKIMVSLRLDKDILDKWRKSGKGWQTRMNDELRKHVGLPPKE